MSIIAASLPHPLERVNRETIYYALHTSNRYPVVGKIGDFGIVRDSLLSRQRLSDDAEI